MEVLIFDKIPLFAIEQDLRGIGVVFYFLPQTINMGFKGMRLRFRMVLTKYILKIRKKIMNLNQ